MGLGLILPNIDASNRTTYAQASLAPLHKEAARTPGLIHFVDPLALLPASVANGVAVASIPDMASGKLWRASPGVQPTLYTDSLIAFGRTLFDTRSLTECGLTMQESTFTPSFTFITMLVPELHTIDGTIAVYLMRVIDPGVTARFSFSGGGGATPTLLLREDTLLYGLPWIYGSALIFQQPVVLACSVDLTTRRYSIYCNDGTVPVATGVMTSVATYATARYVLFGAKTSSQALRCRAGITAIWNKKLADGAFSDMQNMMAQFRTYYNIVI